MKTEFLKALGLEQETINKIMEENGKDVNAEKEKTRKAEGERDNYKTQLDTVNTKLEEFEGVDVKDLQGQITKLQGDLKAKEDECAAKEAERVFTTAIKAAGGRNEKAVIAMLDMESLKGSKNQSEDIKKALEDVKKSDGYLFGADEPINNQVGSLGGGSGTDADSMVSLRAAMGLPEKN